MVGAIIGRGGAKIRDIRLQSGAQVKIGDPESGATTRTVTITGSEQGVQLAYYLVYQRYGALFSVCT